MSGICTKINQGLLRLDTILSGSHDDQCTDKCVELKDKEGKPNRRSHPVYEPDLVTQMGIPGRALEASLVIAWNSCAFIGNTVLAVLSLATAIITSYKLAFTSLRQENVQAWKTCGFDLKYMAQNVYYIVKYVALGLTPLTLGVELYKHCNKQQ